jgi:PPM family protein phosphatase
MRSRPTKKTHKKARRKGPRRPTLQKKISHWAKTDVGLKREANEDSYLADSNMGLYLVADGMGGHAGGDTASRMAVEIIKQHVADSRNSKKTETATANEREDPAILEMLDLAIKDASARIFAESASNPALEGMGTTVTLLLTHGGLAYVAHVGDSRLYMMRDKELIQVTEDHSLVNEQIKAGFITEEEAAHSRFRNIITRSVGFESQVSADTFSLKMQPNDLFLLCSDGLNGMVDDERIGKTIRRGKLSSIPVRLVSAANEMGGEDNITVILVSYGRSNRDQNSGRSRKRRKKGQRKHN